MNYQLTFKNSKMTRYVLLVVTLFSCYVGIGQPKVTISGTTCVASGGTTGYQYQLSGTIQNDDLLTWKITGGVFSNNGTPSLSGTISNIGTSVRVIWNKGITTGKLKVTNNRLGSFEQDITISKFDNVISINSGIIRIGSNVTINGTSSSSLSCVPLNTIWWESATVSNGPFNTIDNAIDKNLTISSISQKRYYRRVLSINGDVYYSNIILLDPQ